MKHEEILTALEEVSDKHIKEAEMAPKKKIRTFLKMAVAAELTEGETRQQILDLFGLEDTDVLRK